MYYVYVLKSEKDNKNYIGYTKNLKLRFELHKNGKVRSTKNRLPMELIYYEACLNQQDATHREKYLKTYHGSMFIGKKTQILFNWVKKQMDIKKVSNQSSVIKPSAKRKFFDPSVATDS